MLFGTVLLFSFVNVSHNYLSDYFIQNSKNLIGQKVDLRKLAEHLGDSSILGFSQAHGNLKTPLNTKVIFWSLTCSPCLEKLSKLAEQSSGDMIVPVNVDTYEEKEQSEAMLKKLAPQYSFYHDKEQFMMKSFKIDYLPTYVVLDSEGFIREIKSGPSIE